MKVYQVGGSVRDQIMGVPTKDIDSAVEAQSFSDMRDEVLRRGCKIFLESPQFLTIRAKHPEMGGVDFSLCRKDGSYCDGRHPDSVEVGTIYEDLARRDFTMNAMAIDTDTGETLDPFNGAEHIKSNTIVAVGNVVDRFEEDRLRAIRAIRFKVTKNMFISDDVDSAIRGLKAHRFMGVSTDRIRDELYKMFAANTSAAIDALNQYPQIICLMEDRKIRLKPTTEIL